MMAGHPSGRPLNGLRQVLWLVSLGLCVWSSTALPHYPPVGALEQRPLLSTPEEDFEAGTIAASSTALASFGPQLTALAHHRRPESVLVAEPAQVAIGPSRTASDDPDSSENITIPTSGSLQQMGRKSYATITLLSSLIAYVSLNSLVRAINPSAFVWYEEDRDEPRWIASSPSWMDRKACRWLGLCGASHFQPVGDHFGHRRPEHQAPPDAEAPWRAFWTSGAEDPDQWDRADRARRQIPDYVLKYAPFVHLFSGEQFWPGDIAEHLYHTTPALNYTPIQSRTNHATLKDLDSLNQLQNGAHVFLTSNDNVEDRPSWLEGEKNIPVPGDDEEDFDASSNYWEEDWPSGETSAERVLREHADSPPRDDAGSIPPIDEGEEELMEEMRRRYGGKPIRSANGTAGYSDAPVILVVTDKGNGTVDAFWFFFYSFNLGNSVFNVRFGNHVGDWEHCLVRFQDGRPQSLFMSAHTGGEGYSYGAVEKIGRRPVIYSATGTHAMYAKAGIHSYILPWGLLHDQTDRGPLWDPVLNVRSFTHTTANDTDTFFASTMNPTAPTQWLYFNGRWGDKFYPLGDPRQYRFAGQYHYVNGPLGPRFKRLDRRHICQGAEEDPCVIKALVDRGKRAKRWDGPTTEEMLDFAGSG